MMSFRRRHVACMKRSGEEGARCCTAQHESASSVFRGEGAHYPCRGGCAKTLVSQCLLHLSLVLLLDLNRAANGTRWKCQEGVTRIVLSKRGRDLHVARVMDLRSDRPSLDLFVQDCAPPAHGHSPSPLFHLTGEAAGPAQATPTRWCVLLLRDACQKPGRSECGSDRPPLGGSG